MRASRFLALVAIFALPNAAQGDEPAHAATMAEAARAWLASLDEAKRKQADLSWDDARRTRWSFLPGRRAGLRLGSMDASQRAAAEKLLRTGLSEEGYRKFRGVIVLERELRRRESSRVLIDRGWRDPGSYHLAVFGTPGPKRTWAWRIEGHHYSRTLTCVRGICHVGPAFTGANPARVPSGKNRDLRVLSAEEDLARKLFESLSGERRRTAHLGQRAGGNISMGLRRDLRGVAAQGLAAGDMTDAQRTLLWKLVRTWIETSHPKLSAADVERARSTRRDTIRFAWLGGTQPGTDFTYRVHGPTFLLELWQARNHIHSVWRNIGADFGAAALRRPR